MQQRAELTFKQNQLHGRHGWLRLTPAYSVKVVQDILTALPHPPQRVLEPFSGSGTTALVCAELGIASDALDINPFLVWLGNAKTHPYSIQDIQHTRALCDEVLAYATELSSQELWFPPIHQREKWWSAEQQVRLAKIHSALTHFTTATTPIHNLLWLAFCRWLMICSNAAFNHQSMSFKSATSQLPLWDEEQWASYRAQVDIILKSVGQPLPTHNQVHLGDARHWRTAPHYDLVVTSPPYCNRMSYIRELRPYMYWLGYLSDGRGAGELDWQAVGGTWGIATSRLKQWQPSPSLWTPPRLVPLLKAIESRSSILANYVQKYVEDMSLHFQHLTTLLQPQAKLFYIVGNSKFYDTLIPIEELYSDILTHWGYENIQIQVLRKRNSKKELFEFMVSATYP